MADDAGRTDALDTLLIAHGSEVVGMHGLVLAVLAIIFNYDGQNLAAVRMQARLDYLYLAGNGSMDRSADKAAGFRDRLSQVHGVANRNDPALPVRPMCMETGRITSSGNASFSIGRCLSRIYSPGLREYPGVCRHGTNTPFLSPL